MQNLHTLYKTKKPHKNDVINTSGKGSVIKSKASVRLTFSYIFNTQRWKQQVQFANQDYTYSRKWESRGIRLQFSYSFGKTKFSARDRETNEDANRIKVKG